MLFTEDKILQMKKYIILFLTFFGLFLQIGCTPESLRIDNPDVTEENEIQDFIWQGMNYIYLWQEEVPNLADDRFSTQSDYIKFLNSSSKPEDFFDKLIFSPGVVDKWSWIVDDYIEQNQAFQGISLDNGITFGLINNKADDVIGYVRLILPNSDASDKNIKRGDIITHVNGTKLNLSNYAGLLFDQNNPTYTLDLAKMENNIIIPTGVSVELTKTEYTKNPVFIAKTIDQNGHKIGYLMYNWFTLSFDDALNEAFSQFKSDGITDLVVDLRYNPGGFVSSAISLSGMITGQFKGDVFSKEQWNSKLQEEIENSDPGSLVARFTDKLSNGHRINSLKLTKVHFIVTRKSASASELVINGLKPYIDVSLVGTRTHGKYVASTTLYDSDNFSKTGVNPNHTYAIQPIIYRSVNKLDESVKDGIEPQMVLSEDIGNLGVLGNTDEPLLNAAIADITGVAAKMYDSKKVDYKTIGDSDMKSKVKNNMFVDNIKIRQILKK